MNDFITCYDCNEEFAVENAHDDTAAVSYCPYCGSELESYDDDLEDLDDEDIRN